MKVILLENHLSTGGAPAFALKRIQSLLAHTDVEVYCIELNFHGADFVVQRNQVIKILGDRFYEAGLNKMRVMDIINEIKPDVVHIEDVAERLPKELATALYKNDRQFYIVETPHDNIFNPDAEKIYHPDLYAFCTPFHEDVYQNMESLYFTIQYPIEEKKVTKDMRIKAKKEVGFALDRKTVLQVGLWTPQKNQKETIAIARKYPNIDFVVAGNLAGNFQFYWEELIKDLPSNFKALGERSDIDTLLQAADIFIFPSTNECSPLSLRHAIEVGLPIVANNLPAYAGTLDKYLKPLDSNLNTITRDYKIPNSNNSRNFALEHKKMYEVLMKIPIKKQAVSISQHFVNSPFLEIKGNSESDFLVQFLDEKGSIYYQNTIKANHWVRLNRQWYTKWRTKVFEGKDLIYNSTMDLEGKKVFIAIDSKSLGDSLAWIPYVEEFRNKHNCTVVCSTFWNKILDYPEIEFVEPGTMVNCYAMYNLGWFWDTDKEPTLCNTIPLQQSASNILGLDYVELKPRLKYDIGDNKYGKYVTIATNSTAGLKFWPRSHWEQVINYLVESGYKVINTSKERNPFNNCYQLEDISIENTLSVIHHSVAFLGLSSGLSWVAYGLGKEIIMIAGFSEPDHEFSCHRPYNTNVCHGCLNVPAIKFDAGDYLFCPHHKNTSRMFECQNSITPEMVVNLINEKMHNL